MVSGRVSPHLPVDVVLEIVARTDAVTIVRSAAVSRDLRAAILGEHFRRQLALRAAAGGGFDAALAFGVSCVSGKRRKRVVKPLPACQGPPHVRFDAPAGAKAVASRDGLVVLRRGDLQDVEHDGHRSTELNVHDTITGHTSVLPQVDVRGRVLHAVLAVDGDDVHGCQSFEILVADSSLKKIQTYSSRDGRWSAVVSTAVFPPHHPPCWPLSYYPPAVIERTVHWFCLPEESFTHGLIQHYSQVSCIVALNVDRAQVTVIEPPPDQWIAARLMSFGHSLILAALPGGNLGIVVQDFHLISLWTLSEVGEGGSSSPAARWSRRVVMQQRRFCPMDFRQFGERSGTLVMYMSRFGFLCLNLGTGESTVVFYKGTCFITQVCLHEINMTSLLRSMRTLT